MQKYMKNNFKFFGLRAPLVKEVFKNFISYYSIQQNELKDLITYYFMGKGRKRISNDRHIVFKTTIKNG